MSLILIDTFACQDDVGRDLAQWRDSDTHSLLVVGGAKLLEAVAKRIDCLWCGADDHAEEILLEEARGGEGKAVLLGQKLSTELDIVLDILELFNVDAHHHVHGCAASDRSHTSDGAESAERGLRAGCQLLLHVLEVRIGDLFEDSGESMLDKRIGVQLNHRVHTHALDYIGKVALVVVDDAPAEAPAWKTVDFGDSSGADNRHGGSGVAEGDEGSLGVIGQSVVDLVRDDRHFEFIGDGQNFLHVLGCEARSARIARVVDKDGSGAWRDLVAQVSQVDLPALFGHEAVRVVLYAKILADRRNQRKAG